MNTTNAGNSRFSLVIIESPFAHEKQFARNIAYTRACVRDCLLKGEAPFASHLLYTQEGILNDLDPAERVLGIDAGLHWGTAASKSVVYVDLGISVGMKEGILRAQNENRAVEYRHLPNFELWLSAYQEKIKHSVQGNQSEDNLISAQYVR